MSGIMERVLFSSSPAGSYSLAWLPPCSSTSNTTSGSPGHRYDVSTPSDTSTAYTRDPLSSSSCMCSYIHCCNDHHFDRPNADMWLTSVLASSPVTLSPCDRHHTPLGVLGHRKSDDVETPSPCEAPRRRVSFSSTDSCNSPQALLKRSSFSSLSSSLAQTSGYHGSASNRDTALPEMNAAIISTPLLPNTAVSVDVRSETTPVHCDHPQLYEGLQHSSLTSHGTASSHTRCPSGEEFFKQEKSLSASTFLHPEAVNREDSTSQGESAPEIYLNNSVLREERAVLDTSSLAHMMWTGQPYQLSLVHSGISNQSPAIHHSNVESNGPFTRKRRELLSVLPSSGLGTPKTSPIARRRLTDTGTSSVCIFSHGSSNSSNSSSESRDTEGSMYLSGVMRATAEAIKVNDVRTASASQPHQATTAAAFSSSAIRSPIPSQQLQPMSPTHTAASFAYPRASVYSPANGVASGQRPVGGVELPAMPGSVFGYANGTESGIHQHVQSGDGCRSSSLVLLPRTLYSHDAEVGDTVSQRPLVTPSPLLRRASSVATPKNSSLGPLTKRVRKSRLGATYTTSLNHSNGPGLQGAQDVASPTDFKSKADLVAYVARKLEGMVESFTFKSATYQMYLKQFLPRPEEKQRRYIEKIDVFPRIPTSVAEQRELAHLRNVQCGITPESRLTDLNGLTIKERLDDILTSLVNKIMFLLVVEFDTWYIHAPAREQIRERLLEFIWPNLPHLHSFFRDHFSLFIEMRIRHFRDSVARYFRDRPPRQHDPARVTASSTASRHEASPSDSTVVLKQQYTPSWGTTDRDHRSSTEVLSSAQKTASQPPAEEQSARDNEDQRHCWTTTLMDRCSTEMRNDNLQHEHQTTRSSETVVPAVLSAYPPSTPSMNRRICEHTPSCTPPSDATPTSIRSVMHEERHSRGESPSCRCVSEPASSNGCTPASQGLSATSGTDLDRDNGSVKTSASCSTEASASFRRPEPCAAGNSGRPGPLRIFPSWRYAPCIVTYRTDPTASQGTETTPEYRWIHPHVSRTPNRLAHSTLVGPPWVNPASSQQQQQQPSAAVLKEAATSQHVSASQGTVAQDSQATSKSPLQPARPSTVHYVVNAVTGRQCLRPPVVTAPESSDGWSKREEDASSSSNRLHNGTTVGPDPFFRSREAVHYQEQQSATLCDASGAVPSSFPHSCSAECPKLEIDASYAPVQNEPGCTSAERIRRSGDSSPSDTACSSTACADKNSNTIELPTLSAGSQPYVPNTRAFDPALLLSRVTYPPALQRSPMEFSANADAVSSAEEPLLHGMVGLTPSGDCYPTNTSSLLYDDTPWSTLSGNESYEPSIKDREQPSLLPSASGAYRPSGVSFTLRGEACAVYNDASCHLISGESALDANHKMSSLYTSFPRTFSSLQPMPSFMPVTANIGGLGEQSAAAFDGGPCSTSLSAGLSMQKTCDASTSNANKVCRPPYRLYAAPASTGPWYNKGDSIGNHQSPSTPPEPRFTSFTNCENSDTPDDGLSFSDMSTIQGGVLRW